MEEGEPLSVGPVERQLRNASTFGNYSNVAGAHTGGPRDNTTAHLDGHKHGYD